MGKWGNGEMGMGNGEMGKWGNGEMGKGKWGNGKWGDGEFQAKTLTPQNPNTPKP